MESLESLVAPEKLEACLYVVATPIGNRGDISIRALQVLSAVDVIAAEDTRNTRRLLESFGISSRLISCHDNNEAGRLVQVRALIDEGKSVALVSDAGTPLISDPGYTLVRQLREGGYRVRSVPGPCALISALSIAGMPTDRFCFEGFLPAKRGARTARLGQLVNESRTMVFYEAPHRMIDFLQDVSDILGSERRVVLARELTKRFETVLEGVPSRLIERMESDADQTRGEFVVMIEGADVTSREDVSPEALSLLKALTSHVPLKVASGIVASQYGGSKKQYYQAGLKLAQER